VSTKDINALLSILKDVKADLTQEIAGSQDTEVRGRLYSTLALIQKGIDAIVETPTPLPTQEQFISALKEADKVFDEIFKELGNKEPGDWGVINSGMLCVRSVLRAVHAYEKGNQVNADTQ